MLVADDDDYYTELKVAGVDYYLATLASARVSTNEHVRFIIDSSEMYMPPYTLKSCVVDTVAENVTKAKKVITNIDYSIGNCDAVSFNGLAAPSAATAGILFYPAYTVDDKSVSLMALLFDANGRKIGAPKKLMTLTAGAQRMGRATVAAEVNDKGVVGVLFSAVDQGHYGSNDPAKSVAWFLQTDTSGKMLGKRKEIKIPSAVHSNFQVFRPIWVGKGWLAFCTQTLFEDKGLLAKSPVGHALYTCFVKVKGTNYRPKLIEIATDNIEKDQYTYRYAGFIQDAEGAAVSGKTYLGSWQHRDFSDPRGDDIKFTSHNMIAKFKANGKVKGKIGELEMELFNPDVAPGNYSYYSEVLSRGTLLANGNLRFMVLGLYRSYTDNVSPGSLEEAKALYWLYMYDEVDGKSYDYSYFDKKSINLGSKTKVISSTQSDFREFVDEKEPKSIADAMYDTHHMLLFLFKIGSFLAK
jgi:hypothetical protein